MSTRGSTGVCSIGGQVLGRLILADDWILVHKSPIFDRYRCMINAVQMKLTSLGPPQMLPESPCLLHDDH